MDLPSAGLPIHHYAMANSFSGLPRSTMSVVVAHGQDVPEQAKKEEILDVQSFRAQTTAGSWPATARPEV
jgi:hypothetical protein